MIARVADGLPLVGTMQEDEQVKICLIDYLTEQIILKWFSDWQKCAWVSKPSEIIVSKVNATVTETV